MGIGEGRGEWRPGARGTGDKDSGLWTGEIQAQVWGTWRGGENGNHARDLRTRDRDSDPGLGEI